MNEQFVTEWQMVPEQQSEHPSQDAALEQPPRVKNVLAHDNTGAVWQSLPEGTPPFTL